MRIAILQDRAEPLDVDANLAVVAAAARQAADAGAGLLVTPELFAVGYVPRRLGAFRSASDSASGTAAVSPSVVAAARAAIIAMARECGVAIVFSLPGEGEPGARAITATLVDAEGAVLLDYAKLHLFGDDERSAFVAGDEPSRVVDLAGVPVSLAICYDIEFPEVGRAAAHAGAQVILVPTALAGGSHDVTGILVPARAIENQIAVVYVNHCGVEDDLTFDGNSTAVDPRGRRVLSAGSQPGVHVFTLEVPHRTALDGIASDSDPWGAHYLRDRRDDVFPTGSPDKALP